MTALKFAREQAGEYNVIEDGKMVAMILKQNASKWITYFCSNPSMKGKPQNVSKTLKDSKAFCERYFESNDAPEMNENSEKLNHLLNDVRKNNTPDVKELMREMLKKDYVIDLTADDVDVESLDLSDVIDLDNDTPFSHFLTEEEALAL